MPSFELDFEVFCGTCGAGLCGNSDTRSSYNRQYPQVTVDACESCLEKARDEGREEGEEEQQRYIDELEVKIADLEEQLEESIAAQRLIEEL